MWKLFKNKEKKNIVVSPAKGKVLPLSEVKDEAFSSGSMGEGYAIAFDGNKIVSPVDGVVEACFPTGHAVGIHSDISDVIVHIGIDTVELNGEGFRMLVKPQDKVKKGDALVEVESSYLIEKGYDATTMVVFTTGENVVLEKTNEIVKEGEEVGYVE